LSHLKGFAPADRPISFFCLKLFSQPHDTSLVLCNSWNLDQVKLAAGQDVHYSLETTSKAYLGWAQQLIELGQLAEAERIYQESLQKRHDHDLFACLAAIRLKQNNFSGALAALKKLRENFPCADDMLDVVAGFETAGFWDEPDLQHFLASIPRNDSNFLGRVRREAWLASARVEQWPRLRAFLQSLTR
jgi:hypothetical protein